ncbi:unnamed protein product, partial [Oppiella nova]
MNEAEALASQLPLTQIGAIPLEDIIGEIPESRCLQMYTNFKSGEQCVTENCKFKGNEHNHCKGCEFCASNLDQLLEHAKTHITQDEATPLIFEESDDGTVCTKECEYYQKERHYHCRMYGCSCAVPISDTSFKKLDHYLMHEQQQLKRKPWPSGEQCVTENCKLKGNEHNHCKGCEFCASNLDQLLEHAKTHITQDEATPLIFEESDDGTVCTKECEYYQKERHYHCRMYGCSCAVPISDTSFKKLDHYLMHEQQHNPKIPCNEFSDIDYQLWAEDANDCDDYCLKNRINIKALIYSVTLCLSITQILSVCPQQSLLNPCKCENDRILCDGNEDLDLVELFARLNHSLDNDSKHFQTFNLRNKAITELKDNTFQGITFDNIYIQYANSLQFIHRNAFDANYLLTKTLLISNNPVLSSPEPMVIFDILSQFVNIESINFSHNNVTDIPSDAFRPINGYQNKLTSLSLSGDFKHLGDNAFASLNSLQSLSVDQSSIDYIPEKAFAFNQPSKQRLDLHLFNSPYINSSSFAVNSLTNIKRETYLDLQVFKWPNPITYLDEKVFGAFLDAHYANQVNIGGQYVNCTDCRTAWVRNIYKNYDRILGFMCTG